MKHFKLVWKHELKKSVPFTVIVNNTEIGIIQCGGTVEFDMEDGCFELFIVPNASRLFGWKAVDIQGTTTDSPMVEIEFAVTYPSFHLALRQAANPSNQLHIISCSGAEIFEEKLVKKYQR